MKRFVPFFLAMGIIVFPLPTSAQIHSDTLTIRQIQEVPLDSLLAGNQNSPRTGDTVTVTGTVIAAARTSPGGPMLFALGNAATIYIVDESGGPWSGLNVRATDSLAAASTLLTAVDTGFVIRVTGVVTQYYTTTQFEIGKTAAWNADKQVEVLDTRPRRPDPNEISLTDLVNGGPTSGIPTAQQWEGAYVVIRDVNVGTVSKNTSTGRYTWTIEDGRGNAIGVYDQSVYFRGGSQGMDPNWAPPPPGTRIESIRGIITSSSQGIVIAPIYPGDITLGSFPPTITTLQRSPMFPTSSDAVTVSATVETTNPAARIAQVTLSYGQNTSPIATIPMAYDSATHIATGTIPAQPDGSVIWYTLRAEDNLGQYVDFPPEGAKSKPFFIVRDGALRIRDIQYTPFSDGAPGCLGATATVRGTVISQADTSSLGIVYIQDAEDPWSGILVRGDASVRALTLGDDVTVRGTVAEGYSSSTAGNTALIDATVVDTHGKASLPEPIVLTTGRFQSGVVTDGTPEAEMYEGMLLRFNDLTITARNADEGSGFYGEFLVDDGSGPMRVDDLGQWKTVYTNDTTKKNLILLEPGMKIRSLTGIMFYSYGNYKLEPRNVADFDGLTSADESSPHPLSTPAIEHYPNPAAAGQTTTIRFVMPSPGTVTLDVFDALGRRVASLLDTRLAAGAHSCRFHSTGLPPGMYITRLQSGGWVSFGHFLLH